MTTIPIRPASSADCGTLAALCETVQKLHVAERADIFKSVEVDALAVWFRDALADATVHVWLAEIEGKPVGFAVVRERHRDENVFCHARDSYEVDQIGVHPDFRRRGIATALLRHIVKSARNARVAEVELTAWAFNHTAHLAFEKAGFRSKHVRFGLVVGRS